MKRAIALLALLAALFSLAGCMTAEEKRARKEALDILNGSSPAYTLSTGTALPQQTLLEYDDLIIELAGIQGDPDDSQLVLAIRNGTRSPIALSVDHLAVNGWQVTGWCEPYEVGRRTITLAVINCGEELSLCGIEDIATIDLALSVYDAESYDDIAATAHYLTTDTPAQPDLSSTPEGKLLLDEGDYRVSAIYFPGNTAQGSLTLCLENGSQREVYVDISHARLNGEPIEFWFWYNIAPGARYMTTEWLYTEDDFDPLPIGPEDELSFDLTISDYDTDVPLVTRSITLSPNDL